MEYVCDNQMNIFDFFGEKTFKFSKKVRLIELFGGIGSQAMALKSLGVDFEHYRLVEFDKYCIKSYNAIHGTEFEPLDICDVHGEDLGIEGDYEYLLTYSFPCTDLSVAGEMKGMSKGSGTRSGLLWEVERILNECERLPDVLLMENVTQVHGKKNLKDWEEWKGFLESKGYKNFVKDMDASKYGVPQHRNRCFMVSLLHGTYKFPNEIPLKKVMLDLMEDKVDEKYYISNERADRLIKQLEYTEGGSFDCNMNHP